MVIAHTAYTTYTVAYLPTYNAICFEPYANNIIILVIWLYWPDWEDSTTVTTLNRKNLTQTL